MILDIKKFEKNAAGIAFYAREINRLRKEKQQIFRENKEEIIKCREELVDLVTRDEQKEYLKNHETINKFNNKQALIDVIEELIAKIKLDTSCFVPNKRLIITTDNNKKQKNLFDLETDECIDITSFDFRRLSYLEEGLEKVNSLVGVCNLSDTFVMKIIYCDLKQKNPEVTNKCLYNEYREALKYDNTCKKDTINLNEELIKLNHELYEGKIDKQTYELRSEMLKLIESDNIDDLYLRYTKISKKQLLVDAYCELSNNENNYYKRKIRTRSPLINMAVYYSKYLPNNNDKKNSSN